MEYVPTWAREAEREYTITAENHTLRTWQAFYEWAHGRYHMLEDGYDAWIGDDS